MDSIKLSSEIEQQVYELLRKWLCDEINSDDLVAEVFRMRLSHDSSQSFKNVLLKDVVNDVRKARQIADTDEHKDFRSDLQQRLSSTVQKYLK